MQKEKKRKKSNFEDPRAITVTNEVIQRVEDKIISFFMDEIIFLTARKKKKKKGALIKKSLLRSSANSIPQAIPEESFQTLNQTSKLQEYVKT